MADTSEILTLLRFELKFLEDGGYGKSPHDPRRPSWIFEDSPTCLNFEERSRSHPCHECFLMQFVPQTRQQENVPCRHIPLTEAGKTVDDFYRDGEQPALEEALKDWLQKEIKRLEAEVQSAPSDKG
jgi:hypothetical protein